MTSTSAAPFRVASTARKGEHRKLIIALIVFPVLLFVVLPVAFIGWWEATGYRFYFAPSASMAPTIQTGDRMLTKPLASKDSRITAGAVVIFNNPEKSAPGQPSDARVLVKRVVAGPGDTIESREGKLYVNDRPAVEKYLSPETAATRSVSRLKLAENQYYLLGDNRENSFDSRVFGPINRSDISRGVTQVMWPLDHRHSLD